ncbi:MAG: hypothetical protein IJ183_03070 [Prevotella sp.]|nr:hypothetical protein [Prevotella sp.]MBQ9236878.1 hypothetical protein [Prevotella sp.]MBR1840141.1 hypothetical protein [Prevotella sp.]
MSLILSSVLTLGIIALIAAVILFICAKKFAVQEDPRQEKVAAILPQANCGGCGFPGCSGFAAACFKAATEKGSIDGLSCPVGGAEVMDQVTAILFSEDGGEAAPASNASASADAPKKAAGPLKPMSTDPKPFVEPKGLDFSGPKANPVPTIPAGPKPAILPAGWPASVKK